MAREQLIGSAIRAGLLTALEETNHLPDWMTMSDGTYKALVEEHEPLISRNTDVLQASLRPYCGVEIRTDNNQKFGIIKLMYSDGGIPTRTIQAPSA